MARILYDVLGLSIKLGRIAIRLPAPKLYVKTLVDLLAYHGASLHEAKLKTFAKKLDAADCARNLLAHSLFFTDSRTGKLGIQLVRGSWALDSDVFPVSRALMPETQIVDRAFLKAKRKAIEDGIRTAKAIGGETKKILRALNEKRRIQPERDRRLLPHI